MNILLTGSSSGIGRWLARRYCEARHQVWGIARRDQSDFVEECKSAGLGFRATRVDVSEPDQLDALRIEVERDWGHLDGLICCAGVQGPLGPATSLQPAEWSRSLAINLSGTFFTLLALHGLLLKTSRRAKIICFSGGGSTAPRPNFTPYAVAKAGVVRMVENLAHEWTGLPVDVNAIAPGAINTRMTDEVIAAGPAVVGEKEYSKTLEQKRQGGTPLAKVGELIDFLLTPESDHITGRLISGLWDPYRSLPKLRRELDVSDIYTLRRIVPKDRGFDWA